MRRTFLVLSCLSLAALAATLPSVARAACVTPLEVAALGTSVSEHLKCARQQIEQGDALPCTPTPAPACAGSGVDEVLGLVTGAGLPASVVGPEARAQQRCQRAILTAATRFTGKRLRELAHGRRETRVGNSFKSVRATCDGVATIAVQGTVLPTLGGVCAGSAGPGAAQLDGVRVARCERAALERASAAMTVGVLRPNIVLVMTDDQNVASMPWLSRVGSLQGRALNFSNAFATTPVCGPSRSGIFSALYAHHHGVLSNYEAAPNFAAHANSTIATWLHDAGYATALIGKYMNFVIDLTSIPPGWDEWQALIGEESGGNGFTDYRINENGVIVHHGPATKEYSTDLLAGRTLDFIKAHAERPFFVMYTPFAPHLPAIPAQRHAGSLRYVAPWRPANWRERNLSLKPFWVQYVSTLIYRPDASELDAARSGELETLLAVDQAVGNIEDLLENLGLTDNTIIVFTSDHGYHWGEHWWESKFTQYEESLRVPLVLSYPVAAPEPATLDELVVNIDLAPTLAELAGAVVPPGLDGRSIAALVGGTGGAVRDDFLIQNWPSVIVPAWEGVRGTQYKYAHTDSVSVPSGVTEELYDEIADPVELHNLASDPAYASTLDALRARLAELQGE